jgi:hypothetical protein
MIFHHLVTLDEDVCLENNARRCILDCACVCVLSIKTYNIHTQKKEIETNEVKDNINRKRETQRRSVDVYVRARVHKTGSALLSDWPSA